MSFDNVTIRAIYSARALARALSGASGNIGQALDRANALTVSYLTTFSGSVVTAEDEVMSLDTAAAIAAALGGSGEVHCAEPQPTPQQILILRDLVRGPPNAFLMLTEKDEREFRAAHGRDITALLLGMGEVGLCVVSQPVMVNGEEQPARGAPKGSRQWTACATPTGRAAVIIYDDAVKRAVSELPQATQVLAGLASAETPGERRGKKETEDRVAYLLHFLAGAGIKP